MELHFAPFVAGVLAGANGTFVGHPFDTLKTRFQVGRVLSSKVDLFFVRQLYRGILPPLLTSGAIQSTNFFLFENFRSRSLKSNAHATDLGATFMAGSLSGSLISLVSNPISIVKIRQQVESTGTVRHCIKEIYASRGLGGFYRGYSTMLILDASRGLYLTIYEAIKRAIVSMGGSTIPSFRDFSAQQAIATSSFENPGLPPTGLHTSTSPLKSPRTPEEGYFTPKSLPTRMLAAAVTGMVSWCIIYPVDAVRVRLHLDFTSARYIDWRDCCVKTYAEGGVRLFYRGLVYTLIRAGPVSAASLTTYEFTKDLLEKL